MTDDVKDQAEVVEQTDGGAQVDTQVDNEPQGSQEVDYSQEVAKRDEQISNLNKALREARRAQRRSSSQQPGRPQGQQATGQQTSGQQYDPRYVADLEQKVALSQLKEGAKDILKDYPELPKHIKKAIIRNPRGFVQMTTTSIDDAIEDIRDFIEDEMEGMQPVVPPKKQVQISGGNTPEGQSGKTPAEIEAILKTPVDEWTSTQRKALEDYKASHA